ncbi:MAG: isocitrate/isopropylmalate dehydrogenase family protein [Sorangiineae bacterium]|nr:isocitrate/isopropylmalate dehydrogenase family protein [Polyangiaceae bacterium]MEB2324819.1 isocitrate/isopropylmalate dehydrogenase family protein [Sorangiineae bacterium]
MPSLHTVVLIPGDGIGPEVADATRKILEAAGAPLAFVERQAGVAALDAGAADVLPEETVAAIRHHHFALKGPCTTPIGAGFSSVNVALRKKLNLFAAVRPVRSLPGVKTRYDGVDLVIIRENTEGLYSGIENLITDGVVVSMKVATRQACHRIAHWAFRYATHRKRKKISVFHKANIMKLSDGLLLGEARQVHENDYPNIEYDEVIIDAAQMKLVQDPSQFDIILCENLYGDIVSDLAAGLVGGLGVSPGANIGDEDAVFEAVHGSAPDIAGRDLANPLALVMSATMMLNHIADVRHDPVCREAARRIKAAYGRALEDGAKTRDLGGELGTRAFTEAVIARLAG